MVDNALYILFIAAILFLVLFAIFIIASYLYLRFAVDFELEKRKNKR